MSKLNCVRAVLVIGLLAMVLVPRPIKAQCDYCVSAAVGAAATSITTSIATTNTALATLEQTLNQQLIEIGNALASINTANVAQLERLAETNHQGIKTMVRELHELITKEGALEIKRGVDVSFGARSLDYCIESETTLGVLDTKNEAYQQALFNAKAFSSQVKSNTKSTALRRRIMSEYVPAEEDFGAYFSSDMLLSEDQLAHVASLSHVLAQNTVFPIAPSPDNAKENDRSRYYRELKRERDIHGAVVEDVIARSMLINAPLVPAADFVKFSLAKAGIDPEPFMHEELTSEAAVIRAIGVSNFGSANSIHNAAISGEELLRLMVQELGKTNFVLAKQYEALKDLRYLAALDYSKQVETFFNAKLERAYRQLN